MDVTECGVCYQKYNATSRPPFIGTCGHSYCGYCIIQIEQTCPTCREKSFILPKRNFLAIEMLELVKNVTPSVKARLAHCEMYESLLKQAFDKQKEETLRRDELEKNLINLESELNQKRMEKALATTMLNQKTKLIDEKNKEIIRLNGEVQNRERDVICRDNIIAELQEKLRREEMMRKTREEVYISTLQQLTGSIPSYVEKMEPTKETEQICNEFHQKKLKRRLESPMMEEKKELATNIISPFPSSEPMTVSCSAEETLPPPAQIPLLMIAPPGYFERYNRGNIEPSK